MLLVPVTSLGKHSESTTQPYISIHKQPEGIFLSFTEKSLPASNPCLFNPKLCVPCDLCVYNNLKNYSLDSVSTIIMLR